MVRLSCFLASAVSLGFILLVTPVVCAQDDTPNYNEESVGMVDYSDSVAAGTETAPTDATADTVVSETPEAAPTSEEGAEPPVSADDASLDETPTESADADLKAGGDASLSLDEEGLDAEATGGAKAKNARDKQRDEREMWEWGARRHHMGWDGTAGLMDIKEAGSNETGNINIGLFGGFFKYSDYLIKGDENTAMAATLNLRATVWKYLEFHSAIRTFANHNTMEYPELFQTIGDVDLGFKIFGSPSDLITLGLDLNFNFLNSVGKVGIDWSGVSFGMDGLATFDFASISDSVPFRSHLLVGYLFDNAYHLIEDAEAGAGGCGSDLDNDGEVEYQGCLSPVERTALGIDRNDQFRLGIGFDALFPYVSPMLEYRIDIPVNRQDFVCPQIPGSYDSCMADSGAQSMRQWINIGVRALPPVKGISVDFGVEIGVAGYAPSVHELAAQEPYMIKFGLGYQFNPFEKTEKCEPVEKIVKVPAKEPAAEDAPKQLAQIVGMVHDAAAADVPVADALVVYQGLELNPQVTSGAGRFNSYQLPAGEVTMVISAPDYEEQVFTVLVPEEGYAEQLFPLVAKPKRGVISLSIVDDTGVPVTGLEVQASGTVTGSFTSDGDGKIMLESDAGTVSFTVSNDEYLHKKMSVDVKPNEHEKVQMELRKKSKKTLVIVKNDRIRIKRKIHFKTNSAEIESSSFSLLDEVADILLKSPQILKVEIQGHTDDRGGKNRNIELSQSRAESVRTYLMNSGVDGARLVAEGFGPTRPIAPNIISSGRARNRRVEFHIIESGASGASE